MQGLFLFKMAAVFALFQAGTADARALQPPQAEAVPVQGGAPAVVNALQDMVDASSATKAQFSAFSDRVYSDVDRLQHEFQKERQEISDLKLEKQSMQAEQDKQRVKLGRELDEFKRRTLGKLTDLQAENKRLEEHNTILTTTNAKLGTDLEAERSKKEVMIKKLKKFAELFNHQNQVVNQMYQQQQKRVADEVSLDMKDAMEIAGPAPAPSAAMALPLIPAAPPVVVAAPAVVDPLEAAMTLPAELAAPVLPAAVAVELPVPEAAMVPAPSNLRRSAAAAAASMPNVASPHAAVAHRRSRVLNTPRPPTAQKMTLAMAPAAGVPPPQAAVVLQPVVQVPPPQPAQAAKQAPVADDEQLKSLRAEVESLEASVKDDDTPQDPAQGTSLLEITGAEADAALDGADQ